MESIAKMLTSETFLSNIPSVLLLVVALAILAKILKIRINTDHITIGGEDKKAYYERSVVRNQVNQAKLFCMALENKIIAVLDEPPKSDGYYVKYILECVYDKIVEWIMYNHIENTEEYIESKQWEIQSLVYSFNPPDKFKTPEFKERMDRWTAEIIGRMVSIRKLYNKKGTKKEK
jgi:predicted phosphohydrolase